MNVPQKITNWLIFFQPKIENDVEKMFIFALFTLFFAVVVQMVASS